MLRFSQAPKGLIELRFNHCVLPKSPGICSPATPLPRSASGFAAAGAETRPSSQPASLAFPAHFPEVSHPLPAAGLISCSIPPALSTQQLFWTWRTAKGEFCGGNMSPKEKSILSWLGLKSWKHHALIQRLSKNQGQTWH